MCSAGRAIWREGQGRSRRWLQWREGGAARPHQPGCTKPLGDIAADMLQQAGMNVNMPGWIGVVLQRQLKKDPVAQGGWSAGVGNWQGIDWLNPAGI